MPSIETCDLHQRAVIWTPTGNYGNEAEATLNDPVEINVRWEETQDQIQDPFGNTIQIDAKVVVDTEYAVESILWLGSIDDLPTPPTNLKKVVGLKKTPDIKNRNTRLVLLVSRHSNLLPTVE